MDNKFLLGFLLLASVFAIGCLEDKTVASCGNSIGMEKRVECITSAAIELNDSTKCSLLPLARSDECVAQFQVETEQFACDKVVDATARDYCNAHAAVAQQKPELCSGINDVVYKTYCVENTKPAEKGAGKKE